MGLDAAWGKGLHLKGFQSTILGAMQALNKSLQTSRLSPCITKKSNMRHSPLLGDYGKPCLIAPRLEGPPEWRMSDLFCPL